MNVLAEEIAAAPAASAPAVLPARLQRRSRLGRGRTWMLGASDLGALLTALAVTLTVRDASPLDAPLGSLAAVLLAAPLALALLAAYRLYDHDNRRLTTTSFDEVRDIFHALVAGSLLFLLVAHTLEATGGRATGSVVDAAIFVPAALLLLPLARGSVRSWVFPRVMLPRRAMILGSGDEAELVHRKLDTHPEYGLEVVSVVDDEAIASANGNLAESVAAMIDRFEIDRVVLASSANHEQLLDFVRAVRRPDVQVSIVPRFFEIFTSNATLDELEGMPLVTLPPMRLGRSSRLLKRTVDIAVSSLVFVVLGPVLAAIALAIRLDSPGPVIYRQPRRGKSGTTFTIAKFRTMYSGAEQRRSEVLHLNDVDGPLFKVKTRDPRVTRVGAFLRKTSLDELPQLWNVLRGEMSLVGPRPFVVYEADQIGGWARRRLEMTPGITGLWQVLGRNDIPFDEMVKLDYIYVTNWSPWWDFKIMCQTIPVVLGRRGAY